MKKTNVGKLLIESLEEAVSFHEGKVTLKSRVVEIPEPPQFSSQQIKRIRNSLNVSQPLFAKFFGVSDKAVKGWEQGKPPGGSASRLLQFAKQDPAGFQKLVLQGRKKSKSA